MKKITKQLEYYLRYCENTRRMSETTLHQKRKVIEKFIAVTDLDSLEKLTNTVFEKWITHGLAQGVSPCSMNAYNSIIVSFVKFYGKLGLKVPLNLALIKKLHEPRVQRQFYTASEIQRVVSLADHETGLMIKIMFDTGMRIAELTRLKRADFNGRQIQFIGKGGKSREVYIRESTLDDLKRYVNYYGIDNYLWSVYDGALAPGGEPPTAHTIRKRLQQAFLKAGFEDFYPHSLRHSFATDLQLKGASIDEIKEMLGHESIATTERYLHGFDGKLKNLFDKYQ